MFDFLFKNFWLVLILVTVVNVFALRIRSKPFIRERPQLKAGYEKLFRGALIFLNIPWVVAGIAAIFGNVSTVSELVLPSNGNPFVLAFQLTVVFLWALAAWWIYLKNGADFLAQHPGLLSPALGSPNSIRTFVALMLAGLLVMIAFLWLG